MVSVIRLESVNEKQTNDHRYFIELEIFDNVDNQTWRVAEHVVQKSGSRDLCYPTPSPWQPDVTVYVIVTVKNQGVWIRHFIDNIVDIQEATNDQNIHPIIVDFGSRDSDTDTYLKRTHLKHYSGEFFKIPIVLLFDYYYYYYHYYFTIYLFFQINKKFKYFCLTFRSRLRKPFS